MIKATDTKKKKAAGGFSQHIIPLLLCVLVSITPTLFTYLKNILNMTFGESLIVMAGCAVVGAVVYAAVYWLIRLFAKGDKIRECPCSVCAGLAGAGVLAVIFNCFVIRMVLGLSYDVRHSLIIVGCAAILMAAVVAAAVLISRKDREVASFISKTLVFVCVGMALFNLVLAAPDIATKIRNNKTTPAKQETVTQYAAAPNADLPNVYFFLLDEFAAFDLSEKYYDYPNTEYRDFLTENKFSVSDDSYSVAFGGSEVNIANLCCLEKVADVILSSDDYKKLVKSDSKLFATFSSLGYEQCQISSDANVFPVESLLGDNTIRSVFKSETEQGDTILDMVYNNSFFYYLVDVINGVARVQSGLKVHAKTVTDVFDYYDNIDTAERSDNPTVLFSYVECPHTPFRFDADGNILDRQNMDNWNDPIYYRQQYQYISKRMTSAIESILANDPDCVIIIQSDHGLRHTPGVTDRDTMHIFNAVYYRGEEIDVTGMTSIETFVSVLDRLAQE